MAMIIVSRFTFPGPVATNPFQVASSSVLIHSMVSCVPDPTDPIGWPVTGLPTFFAHGIVFIDVQIRGAPGPPPATF